MLGEGVRAAFEFLGIGHRTVCYVEREAPAAGQLVALMEAGAIDPAPVWSDLTTFDGAAWRGRVDCIAAGFPCQDISIAGRRAGLDGKRSGLFFDILDVADACGAWLSLWRTSQPSLLPPPPLWTKPKGLSTNERPPASWENWPTAGGIRNGSLFPRPMWEPATGASDGSASPGGWPTPDAAMHGGSNRSASDGAAIRPNITLAASQWLTPNVPNGGRSVSAELVASKGTTEDGEKRTVGLESQSKHWATPNSSDHKGAPEAAKVWEKRGQNLPEQCQHWPSPRATDGTKGGPNQAGSKGDLMLPSAAAQWPTPAARDVKGANSAEHALVTGGGGRKHMDQLANFVEHSPSSPQARPIPSGETSLPVVSAVDGAQLSPTTRPAHVLGRRRLNPAFGCWLMGWPSWWTNPGITSSVKSEMASYRCRLQSHLSSLLGEQESST
jgi:hypothetical protein